LALRKENAKIVVMVLWQR